MPSAAYYPLSTRPLVLYAKDWAFRHESQPIFRLLESLANEPTLLLLSPSWNMRSESQFDYLGNRANRVAAINSRARLVVLAPTESALQAMRDRNLPCVHVNQNALADERVFRPLESVRRWDAVYDAKLSPFKRHELASGLTSLALITYRHRSALPSNRRYAKTVDHILGSAFRFNPPGRSGFLATEQVNEALSQCRVGLCLSEVEGTMWASIQYLLAGLPVVTTPSEGGRTEFFHEDYVATVPPDPDAVADGVARMVDSGISAQEISRRTLALMEPHRKRLFNAVDEFLSENGEARVLEESWDSVRVHAFRYPRLTGPNLTGFTMRGRIRQFNSAIVSGVRERRPFLPESELRHAVGNSRDQ